ncbi:MAG TPA: SRPBCC family protein [Candidatus Rothia avicola]|uniref:SRPBCC family protein n=1 Tax=Candidatus Rothia avicola TaxID=2840478 RepID=A0A9D2CP67_9MICC|nr:SRPBCC family protein [Candidatus Rothia avicola]
MTHTFLTRSTVIDAPVDQVRVLIEDLHAWESWSPWQELDPAMQQTYSGAERGIGAKMAWAGNKKAGEGRMTVVTVEDNLVEVDIEFIKPWAAQNCSHFKLQPTEGGTAVAWSMSGEQNLIMKAMFKVFNMQKRISADFERGLARLKAAAEG